MFDFTTVLGKSLSTEKDRLYIFFGSIITFLIVSCMSVYRFINGELLFAQVDFIIALALLICSIRAWRSENISDLNVVLVTFCMSALMAALYFKGPDALYWTFPAVTSIYFLLEKNQALVVTSVTILLTYPFVKSSLIQGHLIEMYPALVLASVFQYCWAKRSHQQKQQLADLASKDSLTKLQNRRSLNLRMKEILLETKRTHAPASILMFDLDHFKKINDKYGHNEGDNILVLFSSLIQSSIRDTDHMFRFGGEEFVVIASNSNLEDSTYLADFLRRKVESHSCCKNYGLTVSIGVTEIDAKYDDMESCLKRADEALYTAKNAGRNKVFTATKSARSRRAQVEYAQYIEKKVVIKQEKSKFSRSNVIPLNNHATNKL